MQLTQKWSLSNRLAHRQAPYTIEYTFPTTWQWRLAVFTVLSSTVLTTSIFFELSR